MILVKVKKKNPDKIDGTSRILNMRKLKKRVDAGGGNLVGWGLVWFQENHGYGIWNMGCGIGSRILGGLEDE